LGHNQFEVLDVGTLRSLLDNVCAPLVEEVEVALCDLEAKWVVIHLLDGLLSAVNHHTLHFGFLLENADEFGAAVVFDFGKVLVVPPVAESQHLLVGQQLGAGLVGVCTVYGHLLHGHS